jgi:hypothetical protein
MSTGGTQPRVEKVGNETLVPGRDEFWDLITRVGYAQLKLIWIYVPSNVLSSTYFLRKTFFSPKSF